MEEVPCQGNRYQLRMRAVELTTPALPRAEAVTRTSEPQQILCFPIRGIPKLLSLRTRPSTSRVRLGKCDSRLTEERCNLSCQHQENFTFHASSGSASHKTRHTIVFLMRTHSYQRGRSTVDIQLS